MTWVRHFDDLPIPQWKNPACGLSRLRAPLKLIYTNEALLLETVRR